MQHQEIIFHFHHYAMGFLAASLAEFNHPASLVLLACGTGVFVQGIAAYDHDPIIERPLRRVEWTWPDGTMLTSPAVSEVVAAWISEHTMPIKPL
mmetsp:Transcript_122593/g.308192  ORF Transcript_122593/g.308192 Transcript_122593/m.308192 type:complete len:95 (-) Transcript_122593:144-428(-)